MPIPFIAYNLHDSVIAAITLEKEDRLLIDIELYPIYYPEESSIQLIFSGISNQKEVAAFHSEVMALVSREGRLGYRVDEFKYLEGSSFEDKQLSLYLAVDHLQPLIIQCKKYRFASTIK